MTIQGKACALSHTRHPPQWKVWLGRLCVIVCLIGLVVEAAHARTDFNRLEQLAEARYGQKAVATVRAWQSMIEKSSAIPDMDKLELANNFVNRRIEYMSDMEVWGVEDYWTTPLELFGKGAGDCEDYAISKYITLLLMNVPVQKLRLVYVRARMGSQTAAHMVLSYFETPTSEPLILDNLTDRIFPAGQRPDLFPVFSFNHEGLWLEGESRSSGDPTSRLSRWRDVLQRMRSEGIDPRMSTLSARSLLSWKHPKYRMSSRNLFKPRSSSKVKVAKFHAPKMKLKQTASTRPMSWKSKTKTAKSLSPSRRIARR